MDGGFVLRDQLCQSHWGIDSVGWERARGHRVLGELCREQKDTDSHFEVLQWRGGTHPPFPRQEAQ